MLRRGIKPLRITKVKATRKKRITQEDITVFTRQLATMMKAGVPLLQAFDIVAKGTDNGAVAKLFTDIKADVENLLKGRAVEFVKTAHPALHPGRAAKIVSDGQAIGFVGELHPKWLQNTTCRKPRWCLKSTWPPCAAVKKHAIRPCPNSKVCASDLAFVLPENVSYDELEGSLKAVNSPLVREIALFDVYRAQGCPKTAKAWR